MISKYLALLDVERINKTGIVLPSDPKYVQDHREGFDVIRREFERRVAKEERDAQGNKGTDNYGG